MTHTKNLYEVLGVPIDALRAQIAAAHRKLVKKFHPDKNPGDADAAYRGLDLGYVHGFVDHITKYVEGRVHTNGMENFWSLFKRALHGTYIAVAPFHLQRYVDEQAFRFNGRKTDDANRFWAVLSSVVDKRLTYRVLTAQGDAGFMGIQ